FMSPDTPPGGVGRKGTHWYASRATSRKSLQPAASGSPTEKKSLVKIGEPSRMSTRFFATRFFQMPARGRGGKSEGAKKTPRIFQTEFFFECLLRTWWGIR